jgi:hypothetical protein
MESIDKFDEKLRSERKKIKVDNINYSTREVFSLYNDGVLVIDPSYQRKYRWDDKMASKFIESIYLGLPIPPIFVATNDTFTQEVVDGVQRISTIIRYMTEDPEILNKIGKNSTLNLKDLEKLEGLNGVKFSETPEKIKRYFLQRPLQFISLNDMSDVDVRYDLFHRINTGSVALTEQEIRSAVYRGKFIEFVEGLSKYPSFSNMLKVQKAHVSDGTIAEQVIKFFAYKNYRDNFKGSVKDFLNQFTKGVFEGSIDFDYEEESKLFEDTTDALYRLIGEKYFINPKGNSVTPMIKFEASLVGVATILATGADLVDSLPENWMRNEKFHASTQGATNTPKKLKERIEAAADIFTKKAL